jgi:hypothetical protein
MSFSPTCPEGSWLAAEKEIDALLSAGHGASRNKGETAPRQHLVQSALRTLLSPSLRFLSERAREVRGLVDFILEFVAHAALKDARHVFVDLTILMTKRRNRYGDGRTDDLQVGGELGKVSLHLP